MVNDRAYAGRTVPDFSWLPKSKIGASPYPRHGFRHASHPAFERRERSSWCGGEPPEHPDFTALRAARVA